MVWLNSTSFCQRGLNRAVLVVEEGGGYVAGVKERGGHLVSVI